MSIEIIILQNKIPSQMQNMNDQIYICVTLHSRNHQKNKRFLEITNTVKLIILNSIIIYSHSQNCCDC